MVKKCFILEDCQINTGKAFVDVKQGDVVDLDFKDNNTFIELFKIGILRNVKEDDLTLKVNEKLEEGKNPKPVKFTRKKKQEVNEEQRDVQVPIGGLI